MICEVYAGGNDFRGIVNESTMALAQKAAENVRMWDEEVERADGTKHYRPRTLQVVPQAPRVAECVR